MKIKNPLDKDLNLNYKGVNYVLEAGVSKEFPEDVSAQWITIYGFLSISSDKESSNKEVVAEAAEEKSAKKATKKTTKKSSSSKSTTNKD